MMKERVILVACALSLSAVFADARRPAPVRVTSGHIAADNVTGSVFISGDTMITTCTNDHSCLHWKVTGEGSGQRDRYVMFKDMWVYLWDVPVMWMPYWYYPMDTDYGWRVMPGYRSRWGAYLLTKYVYDIAKSQDGDYSLKGNTRFDLRQDNGVALGQSLRWKAGDFGEGLFKVYYAWDRDADHYDRHWDDPRKWNYRNWGSTVPDERYAMDLEHRADLTERDIVRMRAAVYSDSHFHRDFMRESLLGGYKRYVGRGSNELAWEHNENILAFGASVSGPLDEFYGGVARLPEFYFDVSPMPLFTALPVNYESSSRIGYLNRDYAKYGDETTDPVFRYNPGRWADYNTFRMDTYHRLTVPMKWWDVLAVAPRFGLRGTYWGESGYESLDGTARAGRTGDEVWRSVVEGGVTFAGRASAWIDGRWRHVTEPYLDILCQEADFNGPDRGERTYVFDSIDASMDWQDQFAGRSRNLPYSWYGVTPGWRNVWEKADDRGGRRTVFDLDIYASVQFNDTEFTEGDGYHRLVRGLNDPNYGEDRQIVPGFRVRWLPHSDMMVSARAEYDGENDDLSYADLLWRHKVCSRFNYYAKYVVRDFRWWDFSSSPYDPEQVDEDLFNLVKYRYFEIGCEHELCDSFAWGPYLLWDGREGELDEIGTWFDYRTDCLGFRLSVAYENDYERIDGSESEDDWRVGFFIYLRAIGPGNGSPLGD